jgi:hypothetical protein
MPPWAWIVVLVLLVASRPIEARLWRAGRLSDQAVTILLLSRLPLLALIAVVAQGASLPIGVFILGISLLPLLIGYRWLHRVVRDQRLQSTGTTE